MRPVYGRLLSTWEYKFFSAHPMRMCRGSGSIPPLILNLRKASFPLRWLFPGERASTTHWIGGWLGPIAGLDECGKEKVSYPHGSLNPEPSTQWRLAVPTTLLCHLALSSDSGTKFSQDSLLITIFITPFHLRLGLPTGPFTRTFLTIIFKINICVTPYISITDQSRGLVVRVSAY